MKSKFRLYIGGINHWNSPIAKSKNKKFDHATFQNLPGLHPFPMYNSDTDNNNTYHDDHNTGFFFSEENYYTFSLIFSNDKIDFDLGSNLIIAVVPTRFVKPNDDAIAGKLNLFDLPRALELHNTGVDLEFNTTSNRFFVSEIKRQIVENISRVKESLLVSKATFELTPIKKNSPKRVNTYKNFKALHIIKTNKGKAHKIGLEKHCSGVVSFSFEKPSILSNPNVVKAMGVLPNHFLNTHFIFKHFDEINLGVLEYPKN